ncbi:hypothetical protein LPJ53_001424 [Coemansia erecta]|uniref:Uncharacterized protein n=1 Tax=Coemansia erecta TaxID=147472 RepID=A0A9W8CUW0_9FUNG|nr:hypothetical protein LPJ53_001424 [Coemansia erecta]
MNSISECLNEDAYQSIPPMQRGESTSDSSLDLDISMLFEGHGSGVANMSYNRLNNRNGSLDGFSGINSSFFASQDIASHRCLGETTVSDFGISRYGNPYNPSYQAHPINLDVQHSCDTLPEYVPTSALPPAYSRSLLGMSPHSHLPATLSQTYSDFQNASMSRANILPTDSSSISPNRSYSQHGQPTRNGSNIQNTSLVANNRGGLIDFTYFPRKMT